MATLTSSLIVVAQLYSGDLIKQTNRASVALQLLPKKTGRAYGLNVGFVPVNGAGVTAETYSEGADASTFTSDAQASASIPWGLYRKNFQVTQLAQDVAANAGNPMGNVALIREELIRASEALGSKLNIDTYTGAGANSLIGLEDALGDAANTYATIDRSVGGNAYWRPQVFNAAGPAVAITFEQIRSDMDQMFLASGERPDLMLVHPNVYRKIASLFDAMKQMTMATDVVRTSGGDIKLDGSRGSMRFESATVVEDKDATDGQIFYVNTKYASYHWIPRAASSVEGMTQVQLMAPGMPMPLYLEILAKGGPSDKFSLCTPSLQLVAERPNSMGVRFNIS